MSAEAPKSDGSSEPIIAPKTQTTKQAHIGFLEELRLLKEAQENARLLEIQRNQQLHDDQINRAVEAQRVKEAQDRIDREYHNRRHEQATSFYNESRIGTLVEKFHAIVPSVPVCYPKVNEDPDSVTSLIGLESTESDRHFAGRYVRNVMAGENTFVPEKVIYKSHDKAICIETAPDGRIVFHAGILGSSTVALKQWRSTPDILEKALKRAYKHPKSYSTVVEAEYSRPRPDLSD